ncbi:hypothetical protein [Streptomyces sp. E2N166]|uniref:hypothetical protein n=1 Tax=Streptomyces sp. E2N166 TaxID=1851909 RepID=UPI000EF6DBAC|nr:hypothetical protein [Streptomyces sp. E2N166]
MRLPIEPRHVAPRLATGAFMLNSGLSKRAADEQTAAMLHGMAKNTYPFLGRLRPATFARLLCAGETALGAALLLPVVPTVVAGAGLTAFSAGLVGLYLRTPGMREEGSLRPTQEGTALAKDTWLLGIGVGFVVDGLTRRGR